MTVDHTYPSFHLLMDCFICSFKNPIFELKEAEAYKFITKEELDNIKFLPADIKVIEELKKVI